MQTVAFLNRKGGVGKSSCTHHLAGAFAEQGKRVLLVDADPQSSLTQGLLGPGSLDSLDPDRTIAAVLLGRDPLPESVVCPSGIAGVDLMPGSEESDRETHGRPWTLDCSVQLRLAGMLRELAPAYDLCLVDCQPNFYTPSWSALAAADALVVPLQPEDYGAQGIRAILRAFETARRGVNPGLRLAGFLVTMFNARLSIHKDYLQIIRDTYGRAVFETVVPEATDYKEAISGRQPIGTYRPKGTSARVIRTLAEELLTRLDGAIAEAA